MKLLSSVSIKGEIFLEYAFLTYEISFNNKDAEPISAEYIFTLSPEAMVSDLKVMCENGQTIRTSVISVSHAAKMKESSISSAILRQIDDRTYSFSIGDLEKGVSIIRLKTYVPLTSIGGEKSIVIPMGVSGYGEKKGEGKAQVSLNIHGDETISVSSPTHIINENRTETRLEVNTGEISADRDFCLRILSAGRENSAIAVSESFGGEMLCRMYPNREFTDRFKPRYKRILFIYDGTGSLLYGASRAGREILCEMAETFSGEFALISAEETPKMITNGFCKNTADSISSLIEKMSNIQIGAGSLASAVEYASHFADSETLTVLVLGTELVEGEISIEALKRYYKNRNLCVVTVGGTEKGKDIERLTEACCVRREHIYGRENISVRAGEILNNLCRPNLNGVQVRTDKGEAYIVDLSDDGITVFVKYSGETPPREIYIRKDEKEQKVAFAKISVYHSFAPIRLVHAKLIYSKLAERLSVCDAQEVCEIRALMEETGIKYSAINSETALAGVVGGDRTAIIRVALSNATCNPYEVFKERPSMFREGTFKNYDEKNRKQIFEACVDIIIRNMRADGAICAGGEINEKIRKQQTQVALLGLIASGMAEKYKCFIEKGVSYTGADFEISGLKFTKDKELAREQIRRLWGSECVLPSKAVPDLLSAVRFIAIQKQ